MRKYVIFLFTILSVYDCSATDDTTVIILKKQVDRLLEMNASQIRYNKEITDSLRFINEQLVKVEADKTSFSWKDIIPWLFSCSAILLTFMLFRRDVSFRNVAFVTDVNKMKITDPSLWAFYDEHVNSYKSSLIIEKCNRFKIDGEEEFELTDSGEIKFSPESGIYTVETDNRSKETKSDEETMTFSGNTVFKVTGKLTVALNTPVNVKFKSKEDLKLDGKITAYCYYMLNSFDIVFRYNKMSFFPNKEWETYMIHCLYASQKFRKVVTEAINSGSYDSAYCRRINEFLLLANYLKIMDTDDQRLKLVNSKNRIILADSNNCINKNSSIEEILKYCD